MKAKQLLDDLIAMRDELGEDVFNRNDVYVTRLDQVVGEVFSIDFSYDSIVVII